MSRLKILKKDDIILSRADYEEISKNIILLDNMVSYLRYENNCLANRLIYEIDDIDISKNTLISIIKTIADFRETHNLGPNEIIIMANPEAQFTKIFKPHIKMQKVDINITK